MSDKNKNSAKTLSEDQLQAAGGAKNVRRLFLPLDDMGNEELEVIAKVPDRRTMGQYMKYQNSNPAKAQEILVKNCLLTDKEAVCADDNLFFTCVSQLAELIPIREGRTKNY